MKKNKFYIYFLRRPDKTDPLDLSKGQPFYVGKGYNNRVGEHRREAERLRCKPGKKLQRINIIHKLWKQGLDFQEEIYLDNLSEEDAFALEIAAIEQYGRADQGTGCLANLTNGGEGMSGLADEVRQKIAEKKRGQKHSLETRAKMSELRKGQGVGRKHTEEHKEKNRQAHLGKKHTPETIEKRVKSRAGYKHSPKTIKEIKDSNTGKKRSLETKEKLRQANLGKKATDETKQKMSDSHKGHVVLEETRKKISDTRKQNFRKEKNNG